MFTGIIEEVGKITEIRTGEVGARIGVSSPSVWEHLTTGESICVNGVCLTVVEVGRGGFAADISDESLKRSTLGKLKRGFPLNLERALRLDSRLGGHIVLGHVDGVGRAARIENIGESRIYSFTCPPDMEADLVEKGSIAVDGVSLTISSLREGEFKVAVVPHTLKETNLRGLKVGDSVNLETDIIAKYVRRYLEKDVPSSGNAGEGERSLYRKLVEGGFA